jgi:hypothetical protein
MKSLVYAIVLAYGIYGVSTAFQFIFLGGTDFLNALEQALYRMGAHLIFILILAIIWSGMMFVQGRLLGLFAMVCFMLLFQFLERISGNVSYVATELTFFVSLSILREPFGKIFSKWDSSISSPPPMPMAPVLRIRRKSFSHIKTTMNEHGFQSITLPNRFLRDMVQTAIHNAGWSNQNRNEEVESKLLNLLTEYTLIVMDELRSHAEFFKHNSEASFLELTGIEGKAEKQEKKSGDVPIMPEPELSEINEEPPVDQHDSHFDSGVKYRDGVGVPQDYVLAHQWFNLSAASGNDAAGDEIDKLAEIMTSEQIANAQKLARDWFEQQ